MVHRQSEVRLRIASRLEELEIVDRITEAVVGFTDLGNQADRITLAVHEATVNAIVHGNRLQEDQTVEIRFVLEESQLSVRVVDQGTGFDPSGVGDPLAPENLLKPRGRGIFLIKSLMDEVTFSSNEAAGTTVTMRKRLVRPRTEAIEKQEEI